MDLEQSGIAKNQLHNICDNSVPDASPHSGSQEEKWLMYFEHAGYDLLVEMLAQRLDDATLDEVMRGLDRYYEAQIRHDRQHALAEIG